MRKLTLILVGIAALAATSVAVAHGVQGAKTAKAVSASFSANAASATTRTCTTTDNKTITITDAKYTGNATGDADLQGPITLRARSVVNTTDKVGTVDGSFRIDVSGRDTNGSFSAVYDNGNIAGLAVGHARTPGARLVANISAGFTPGTSFTGGKLGGGTSGGSAVELSPGSCKPQSTSHPEHSEARGTISALSQQSITVAGLTCALPSDKAADVNAKFKQGDAVEIRCDFMNGQNTLTRIAKKGH